MIELLLPYLEEVAAVSATHKLAESLKRVGGLALATAGLCHAMNCLHRVSGSRLPKGVSGTYGDVGEFWSLGVDGHAAGDEARVKVTGLLLPYGPFIPAHPLDRPGASMDGWDFVGDLSVDDTEEYDAVDAAIYGDRVLRICEPDLTPDKCYFGGLYGHFYGRSDVALPLLLPTQVLEKNSIDPASVWRQLCFRGWLVRLDGVLKQIPSFYEAYYEAAANNKERKVPPDLLRKGRYPNFALEVRKIDFRQPGAGVTHIAASVAWKGRSGKERAQTAYFNAQEASEWQKCERSLDARWARRSDLAPLRRPDLAPPPSDRGSTVRAPWSSNGRSQRGWDRGWSCLSRFVGTASGRGCRSASWRADTAFTAGRSTRRSPRRCRRRASVRRGARRRSWVRIGR